MGTPASRCFPQDWGLDTLCQTHFQGICSMRAGVPCISVCWAVLSPDSLFRGQPAPESPAAHVSLSLSHTPCSLFIVQDPSCLGGIPAVWLRLQRADTSPPAQTALEVDPGKGPSLTTPVVPLMEAGGASSRSLCRRLRSAAQQELTKETIQ